jgi:F-type H+-transporting ATPase subunit epsilon
VVSSAKSSERIFVRGGFAEVNPKGLTVLAERAIPVAEMTDEDRAALAA